MEPLRPPCAQCPDAWDLDFGDPQTWQHAVRTCYACPMFTQCRAQAEALVRRGQAPRAVIWAGRAYDNSGRIIRNLDHYRGSAGLTTKPSTRITHLAPTPNHYEADGPIATARGIVVHLRRRSGAIGLSE